MHYSPVQVFVRDVMPRSSDSRPVYFAIVGQLTRNVMVSLTVGVECCGDVLVDSIPTELLAPYTALITLIVANKGMGYAISSSHYLV